MGDVILSTPVLSAIKRSFPTASITMLVAPAAEQLVAGHPHLDAILTDDEAGEHGGMAGLLKLAKRIRASRFDAAIVLHPTLRLALVCALSRIPVRLGTAYRAYSFLFNIRVKQHRKKSGRHEMDLNLDLVSAIGAKLDAVEFFFHIPQAARDRVGYVLKERAIDPQQGYIVLHPGSGSSALDWSAENFGELAKRIFDEWNIPIVITGSKGEKELVDRVIAHAHTAVVRLDGQLDIKELACVLEKTYVVVANSTGPLHLAVALGTEVVGLYCPIEACLPARWGPYNRPDSVLMPREQVCTTCTKSDCKFGNCMSLITVEQVFKKVQEKLGRTYAVKAI
jgi:lipopolysaccharide heptosyltransferase II